MTFTQLSVHCLTINGIPLFSKNVGDVQPIPFPVIGSLNGVHMFGKNRGVDMGCTRGKNGNIYWKEFSSIKLILIIIKEFCDEKFVQALLENIHNSMVMSIGETELNKSINVERLKKKMKLCLPLLESLFEPTNIMSTFIQMTEIINVFNGNVLKNYLTSFTEDLESEFGCITINGKIVIATDKFWQLQTVETSLLSFVIQTQKNTTASDIPIYLPNGSPAVPHRLITVKLIDRVYVSIVCGPEPSLQGILNRYISHYWSPLVPSLRECLRSIPRSFPPEIRLDENVMSVLLLNHNEGQYLLSLHTHGFSTGADIDFLCNAENRQTALMRFYFTANELVTSDATELTNETGEDQTSKVKETYQCFTTHKCYGIRSHSYEIYVLFTNAVPTYTMGSLCRSTLKLLTKDHNR